MKRLSIIIPVYNVEKYLCKCLDCCVKQDIPKDEYEIIVVNDGSPDNSQKIIDEYASKYSNIIPFVKENGGLSSARNSGLKIAKGEYVWFVDSDDYISNNALKVIFPHLDQKNNIIAIDAYIIKEDQENYNESIRNRGLKTGIYSSKYYFKKGFVYPFSGAQYYIVKKTFLESNDISFIEGHYYEDMLYTPSILSFCQNVSYVNHYLYYYLERTGSITGTAKNLKKCEDFLTIMDLLYEQYKSSQTYDGKYILLSTISSMISTYYHYYYSELSNKEDKRKARIKFFKRRYLLFILFKKINIKSSIRYLQMLFN